MRHRLLLGLVPAIVLACSSSPRSPLGDPDPPRPGVERDASDDGPAPAACEADTPPARGATQSCCPDHGVDACGPMLVCAALDGRKVPVCYPERTRKYGESCTSDALCATEHCNPTTGLCDGGPGCPPCNFPLACTRQDFYRCLLPEELLDDSLRPDFVEQESFQAKPAGGASGNCMLERGGGLGPEWLNCVGDRDQQTKWRVIEANGARKLIAARHDDRSNCRRTLRWLCPLP